MLKQKSQQNLFTFKRDLVNGSWRSYRRAETGDGELSYKPVAIKRGERRIKDALRFSDIENWRDGLKCCCFFSIVFS